MQTHQEYHVIWEFLVRPEISWDLVMSEDMSFAEGSFRMPGMEWQVITASKGGDLHPCGIRFPVRWESGVTGMSIIFANDELINSSSLLQKMSEVLGVSDWQEVKGPDSMQLR